MAANPERKPPPRRRWSFAEPYDGKVDSAFSAEPWAPCSILLFGCADYNRIRCCVDAGVCVRFRCACSALMQSAALCRMHGEGVEEKGFICCTCYQEVTIYSIDPI